MADETAIRDLFSIPNPENTGSNVNILSQSMLDLLKASKAGKPTSQGGSGDATPVDNGGIPQVVNNGSIAVNQGSINQRNLVGQPGGAALGENVSGGNSAANELSGEAGNDLLDGGAGRDLLTGGSGADRFRFATAGGFGTAQADRITDFSRSEGDRIELSRSAFGLSAGAAVSFQSVNSDADLSRALGSSTLLVQDLRDGSILFNQNGTAAGAGQGGVFAVMSQGLTLQASDFALVA